MNNTERNMVEVIFSTQREVAGIELYNRMTGHTINARRLKPFLYLYPGSKWGDSKFVVLTDRGDSDIFLDDIGFRTSIDGKHVSISLNQAMWLIDDVK